jgi:hypothetical protein
MQSITDHFDSSETQTHVSKGLLTLQEALALQNEDDLVNNAAHALLGEINNEISLLRGLIGVIDTGEALDLTAASSTIDTTLVGLLAVLEGSSDMHQEESTGLGDGVTSKLAGLLVGSNGSGDDGGTGAGKLGGNEGNALDVGVAVLAGEAQLRGELVANGVSQQEGDRTATLLVKSDLQSTGNGVLSGVHVTSQEDSETLGGTRGVGLAQNLDNLGV